MLRGGFCDRRTDSRCCRRYPTRPGPLGPFAGRETHTFALGAWTDIVCRRSEGAWQHHVHEGGGAYRHLGPCVDHHEPDDMPGTWDRGCPGVDNPVDNERTSRGA